MISTQIAAVAGAVFGLVIIGRSDVLELKILGAAILIAGLYCLAVVPRALARKWRTPPAP
ncbi:MAG: hypothetical protein KF783_07165 [Sphingomonas sp.]|nr:hypothetical protein [Sphingomonas sp.]